MNSSNELSLLSLSKEIELIKIRNSRVELEKAWETSWYRKIGIVCITYLVMVLIMYSIGTHSPFINAIIPTFGYILSTLSMNGLKKWFLQKNNSTL